MFPYKRINIGDIFKPGGSFMNEWVVLDKDDDSRMILVQMLSSLPASVNKPLWKKCTDRLFTIRVHEAIPQ